MSIKKKKLSKLNLAGNQVEVFEKNIIKGCLFIATQDYHLVVARF